MVKYSSELKAEVVSEYLQGDISISLLSKKRNLPRIQVGRWIQNFRLSGADALKRRRVKRSFSVEFKVDVIKYYQTHDETLAEVSAKFDVNSCQISLWRTAFRTCLDTLTFDLILVKLDQKQEFLIREKLCTPL
ncbi:transposase [Lactiplantibacillus pentosus]|uniref:transposase n=1 Tax=Lactiplantibacillus pentosus TaxID=1589 RepID=UPI0021A5A876|nr:transposase [Lactiplantibacillus pentosus]